MGPRSPTKPPGSLTTRKSLWFNQHLPLQGTGERPYAMLAPCLNLFPPAASANAVGDGDAVRPPSAGASTLGSLVMRGTLGGLKKRGGNHARARGASARRLLLLQVLRFWRVRTKGQPVWEGDVQVFELEAPPRTRCYAWSSPIEGSGRRRFFAVLHQPPVDSPEKAVRGSIVHGYRRGQLPL